MGAPWLAAQQMAYARPAQPMAPMLPPMQPGFPQPPPPPPSLVSTYKSPMGYPVYHYRLANGHQVFVEQRPTDAINLQTYVNAGSINENQIQPNKLYGQTGLPSGIAHLDEHCHFLTHRNFRQKNSLVKAMTDFGGKFNASTSDELITHFVQFNREDLPRMISYHGEAVIRPYYDPTQLNQEKTNVLNEKALREDDPSTLIFYERNRLLFNRSGEQTIGTAQDIKRITAQDMQNYFNRYYRPDNLVTVISGNVQPYEVMDALNNEFGRNPARPGPQTGSLIPTLQPGQIRSATVRDPKLNYGIVNLNFMAPAVHNLRERAAMEVIIDLLGGNDSLALLQDDLVTRTGLANAVGVSYEPMKAAGVATFNIHTQAGGEQKALKRALQVIAQLGRMPLASQQVDAIKQRRIFQFRRDNSDGHNASGTMAMEALRGTLPFYLQYEQLMQSVTPQDVMMVANKYLRPNTYAVVFGVPGNTPGGRGQ